MKDKIMVCGDLHLGAPSGGLYQHPKAVQYGLSSHTETVVNIVSSNVKKNAENGLRHVVFAGDIFDKPNPHVTDISAALTLFLDLVKKYLVKVYVIAGNHDCSANFCALDFLSHEYFKTLGIFYIPIFLQTEITFPNVVLPVAFISDCPRMKKESDYVMKHLQTRDQSVEVVFSHGTLEGQSWSGDTEEYSNELKFSVESVKGLKVVMGHIHKPVQYRNGLDYVAYTGQVCVHNFSETSSGTYVLVDSSGNFERREWEDVSHPTQWLTKQILLSDNLDTLRDSLQQLDAVNKEIFYWLRLKIEVSEQDKGEAFFQKIGLLRSLVDQYERIGLSKIELVRIRECVTDFQETTFNQNVNVRTLFDKFLEKYENKRGLAHRVYQKEVGGNDAN